MTLRVLILSRYDDLGASSRLRTLQYVPMLESKGIQITVAPLFSNAYLRSLYKSKNWFLNRIENIFTVLAAYIRRLWVIATCKKYDVVWVEKELFPYLPGFAESLLSRIGVPYVVDYDDAIFHKYDLSRSRIVRIFLNGKLRPLIAGAYAVTAGNTYLADYARNNGATNITIIPTVVDIDRYHVTPEMENDVLRIGWIGSPSTIQYLSIVAEPLRRVSEEKNIVLVTIGAGPLNISGVSIEQHDWSVELEAELLESIHVGIMPLSDSPWEMGKCGYKLIQYMACGKPVIASPIGVNTEIVSSTVGRLAANNDAWINAIFELAESPVLRQDLGQVARSLVEYQFSLQVTAPKVARLIENAAQH